MFWSVSISDPNTLDMVHGAPRHSFLHPNSTGVNISIYVNIFTYMYRSMNIHILYIIRLYTPMHRILYIPCISLPQKCGVQYRRKPT